MAEFEITVRFVVAEDGADAAEMRLSMFLDEALTRLRTSTHKPFLRAYETDEDGPLQLEKGDWQASRGDDFAVVNGEIVED